MNRKIIFFDIDGTLIGEESHIMLESTKEAIKKARKNGHICIINTGRTKKLVGPDIENLVEFDGYIYGCGTMISYHGEEIMRQTFSEEMGRRIIDALRKYKIDAVLEGKENDYNDALDKINTKVFKDFILLFKDKGYGSYEDAIGNFDKFYAYVDDIARMHAFQADFQDELEFVDREHGFFEIMPIGYSKASGMDYIIDILNIPQEDTVAIGDSTNDLPMLEHAKTAIVMGNATERIKPMADYVTTHVDEDGIWNALEWLEVI